MFSYKIITTFETLVHLRMIGFKSLFYAIFTLNYKKKKNFLSIHDSENQDLF